MRKYRAKILRIIESSHVASTSSSFQFTALLESRLQIDVNQN